MRGVRDERALWRLSRPSLRDDRGSDGRRSPLYSHPGKFAGAPLLTLRGPASVSAGATAIEYGAEAPKTIAWDDAAAARMTKIPVFVRGMVVRAVEETCRKNGLDRVTVDELERIRARMPTPKMFGQQS